MFVLQLSGTGGGGVNVCPEVCKQIRDASPPQVVVYQGDGCAMAGQMDTERLDTNQACGLLLGCGGVDSCPLPHYLVSVR